jgi:hypothetical protein
LRSFLLGFLSIFFDFAYSLSVCRSLQLPERNLYRDLEKFETIFFDAFAAGLVGIERISRSICQGNTIQEPDLSGEIFCCCDSSDRVRSWIANDSGSRREFP